MIHETGYDMIQMIHGTVVHDTTISKIIKKVENEEEN